MSLLLKQYLKHQRIQRLQAEVDAWRAQGREFRINRHFLTVHSPREEDRWDHVEGQSFYVTNNGIQSYYSHLPTSPMNTEEPDDRITEPMDIDSEPQQTATPFKRMLEAQNITQMAEAKVHKRAHFSPLETDARPTSKDAGPVPTKKRKSNLITRVQAYDAYNSAATTPHRNNHFEVPEFSLLSDESFQDSPAKFNSSLLANWTPERTTSSPEKPVAPFSPEFDSSLLANWTPERKILSPRSRRSPYQSHAPLPQELYPGLLNPSLQKKYILREETVYRAPEPVRRIGGMFVNLITTYTPTVLGALSRVFSWAFRGGNKQRPQREPQEIVAVETSPNSGKRRAVASQDIERSPTQIGRNGLPGYYPVMSPPPASKSPPRASVIATPPDSRPSSRDEQSPVSKPETASVAPQIRPQQSFTFQRPERRRHVVNPTISLPRKPDAMDIAIKESLAGLKKKQEQERQARTQRDQKIDNLVTKAKNLAIETPEQKALRHSISTRKTRAEEAARQEDERKAAEEASRLRVEREEQERIQKEIRKQAEEKARNAAEIAAEEERNRLREAEAAKAAEAASRPLIPTLSAELEAKIAAIMAITDGSKTVCTTAGGTEISRYDLGRVLPQPNEKQLKNIPRGSQGGPGAWLNDEAVNGFISAIVQRKLDLAGYVKRADKVPPYAAYDTNWWPTVKRDGVKGIGRWSRRKHIAGEKLLDCEMIFFPTCTGAHWTITIIFPKERRIEVLDSAHGKKSDWFRIAREWLQMELGSKYDFQEWKEGGARSQSQANLDDCGAYTCMNALAAAMGKGYEEVTMTSARKFIVAVLVDGFESFEL